MNISRISVTRQGLVFSLLFLIVLLSGCASFRDAKIKKEKASEAGYKLGIAYLNSTPPELQKAFIEFLKAIESNPNNKEAHYAIGHIYAQREDYPNAILSFKKTLAIDPNDSATYNYLGKMYELSKNDAEAILSYQSALKNLQYETPQYPYWNLAMIYLKQKQYDKGLHALMEVRRLQPTNAVVLDQIAQTYLQTGETEKALSFLKSAVSSEPDNHITHFRLAAFYLEKGPKSLATEPLKKVVALAPESTEAEAAKKHLESFVQ
ncbi:MAG: tetratricopeptide repeat protein [Nitrospirota bacterium]